MYETTTQAANLAAQTPGVSEPLCTEIMGRTNVQAERASAIASRLWSLRDRLFSSPPEGGAAATGKDPGVPQALADSWRSRSRDLGNALDDIDRLVSQLSDRL